MSSRRWDARTIGRFKINDRDKIPSPLTAEESREILLEGRKRLGNDFQILYDLARAEYTRGYRCGVCGEFERGECAEEC